MRVVLAFVVLLGACFDKQAVTPCTLTCHSSPCPGDLECGSDFVCQTPGAPICSQTPPGDGGGDGDAGADGAIYVKAPYPGAGDLFGFSVAMSADGGWLVVGAPLEDSSAADLDGDQRDDSLSNSGAVYVYEWDGITYVPRSYIKHPFPDANDQFGTSVALSADGNVLAIGMPLDDSLGTNLDGDPSDDSSVEVGAVFVYERSGPTSPWQRRFFIKPATAQTGMQFGSSVALSSDGRAIAIGAQGTYPTAIRAHPFAAPYATEGGPIANAEYFDFAGSSIAIARDGNTMLVGGNREDGPGTGFTGDGTQNTAMDAGAAWVFSFPSQDQVYCKASNTEPNDQFGTSITIDAVGNVYAVGAPEEDSGAVGSDGNQTDNAAMDAGAVYIFERTRGSSWAQTTYLKSPETQEADHFGRSVALTADGAFLVVGAPGAGAIYAFDKAANAWELHATHRPAQLDVGDELGLSAAVSDDHAVIAAGAPYEDGASTIDPGVNTAASAGSVYVFR